MNDSTPEELLAGVSRRALPIKTSEEAASLLSEMRWQIELHISDPVMKAYLEKLDVAIGSYIKQLEARLPEEGQSAAGKED